MADIPRQGYPNSTLPVVEQNNVPDTIPGFTQIYVDGSGAVLAKTGSGAIVSLGTSGGGSGTVTSVAIQGDGTVVAAGPSAAVTTSGALLITLAQAGGNVVLASPSGGGSGTPAYRKVIAPDIVGTGSTLGQVLTSMGPGASPTWQPAPSGTGTVSSVTFTGDGAMLSSTPSAAVTTSGTVTAALAPSTGNTLWASPVGGGSGSASYRKAIAADLIGTGGLSGQVLTNQGAGAAPIWANVSGGGSGTVTSVAFQGDGTVLQTGPSTAVTTSGNVIASLATIGGNVVLASPVNGSTAAPGYRKLINTDLVGTNSTNGQVLTSAGAGAQPTWSNPATGTVTSVTLTGDGTVLATGPSTAVTSSGTLTAGLANAAQNKVLAGPTAGGPGAPTYRSVVADDMTGGLSTQILYGQGGSSSPTWGAKYAAIETLNTIQLSNGIVSAPSHSFAGAANEGMWRDATALRFSRAGAEKFNIQASENASLQPISIAGATSGRITHAAAAATTNHTVTWPSAQGAASTVLTNDGAGNLSWAAGGGSSSYEFVCLQAGTYQRAQNGAYFMNVGIALSQDVFWYADGTGTIRSARGFVLLDTSTMNVTFTVYKNGAATGITTGAIVASSTFQSWNATGTAVSIVAGDQVGLAIITTSNTPKVTCIGHVKIRQP